MIEISKVNYSFFGKQVLKNIKFHIKRGDFYAITGADDAGKTTLFHILMGFYPDFEGMIKFMGESLSKGNYGLRKNIRFVPDDIIWDNLTAEQYFKMMEIGSGHYNKDREVELCRIFDIDISERLMEMTYRDNKLTAIIAALSAEPELLILDEPINYLDMKTYRILMNLLKNFQKKGLTILIGVEKYHDIAGYAEKYCILEEGEIVKSDTIPVPDYRWKAVTVTGGKEAFPEMHMKQEIGRNNDSVTYLYTGDTDKLVKILQSIHCDDLLIEEISLEEEVHNNFSRWSGYYDK